MGKSNPFSGLAYLNEAAYAALSFQDTIPIIESSDENAYKMTLSQLGQYIAEYSPTGDVIANTVTVIGEGTPFQVTVGSASIDGDLTVGGALNLSSSLPYSELDLTGSIVDADIATDAAIDVTKFGNGAARQLIQTNATGDGVEWTGSIDLPGTLDVTGAATLDTSLTIAGTVTIDGVIDDDTMATASASKLPTSESVKAYVDAKAGATEMAFEGDAGSGLLNLVTQTFSIQGTANEIETSASGQTITIGLPSTITANVTGDVSGNAGTATKLSSQRTFALTGDVTGSVNSDLTSGASIITAIAAGSIVNADISSSADIAVSKLGPGSTNQLLKTGLTGVEWADDVDVPGTFTIGGTSSIDGIINDNTLATASATKLATSAAIKTYVDNATGSSPVLAISGDTGTGSVDLLTQTLAFAGTANEIETSVSGQAVTIGLPSSISVNVTGDLTGNADTATSLSSARTFALTGDVTGSVSSDLTTGASISTSIAAGSIVDADINGAAAISLSKLANGALPTGITVNGANIVDGSISNSDISSSAAIDVSKLSVGTARQVLQTNAIGTAGEWTSDLSIANLTTSEDVFINGHRLGRGTNDRQSNVLFGFEALDAETGGAGEGDNVAIGYRAGKNSSYALQSVLIGSDAGVASLATQYSVAIGYQAKYLDTDVSGDVAVGWRAGYQSTSGGNTLVGYFSGYDLTTGFNQTFLGRNSGNNGTTGSRNVAIGSDANGFGSGSSNVAIGDEAGGTGTPSGDDNIAIGTFARAAGSGDNNIAVGRASCGVTTGANNIAIGQNAGLFFSASNNAIAIGTNASANTGLTTNHIAIGELALSAASGANAIGIGKNAGGSLGAGTKNIVIGDQPSSQNWSNSSNCIVIGHNPTTSVLASNSSNRVRIGNNIAAYNTNDTVIFTGGLGGYLNGSTASWFLFSDERLKADIKKQDVGLSFINDLEVVSYRWRNKSEVPADLRDRFPHKDADEPVAGESGKRYYGFVAQQVKSVIDAHPGVADGQSLWIGQDDEPERLSPGELVPILVKAIQELSQQVESLQKQISGVA